MYLLKVFSSTKRKQMAATLGFRVVDMIVGFVYSIVIARVLIINQFGSLSLINVLILFLVYLCGLQVHTFISARVPGKSYKVSLIYLKSLWFFEILMIIFVSLISYFIKSIKVFEELEFYNYIFSILFFQLIGMDIMRFFFARKRITLANIIKSLLETLPRLMVIIYYLRGIDINITTILTILLVFKSFAVLFGFINLGPIQFYKASFKKRLIKQGILFSAPMLVTEIMQYLTNFGDRWIIKYFWSNYEVGIYSFTYNLAFRLLGVTGGIITAVLYPYLAESYNTSDKNGFKNIQKYMLFVSVGFYFLGALALLLIFPILVKIVGKEDYLKGYISLLILLFGMMLFIAAYPFRYSLVLRKRTSNIMKYTFIGVIIDLGLNFMLIPRFGFSMAAVSFLIANSITLCLFYFESRQFDIKEVRI